MDSMVCGSGFPLHVKIQFVLLLCNCQVQAIYYIVFSTVNFKEGCTELKSNNVFLVCVVWIL
jgi:hypothetical protein